MLRLLIALSALLLTSILAWWWQADELNNRHIWHPDILPLPLFAR